MPSRRADKAIAGAAMLFAALGDPTRLALLQRLSRDGPASISVLAEDFRTSRQGVTKHLYVLAGAGILEGERHGREQRWRINASRLVEAQRHLDVIANSWDAALARLKAHIESPAS